MECVRDPVTEPDRTLRDDPRGAQRAGQPVGRPVDPQDRPETGDVEKPPDVEEEGAGELEGEALPEGGGEAGLPPPGLGRAGEDVELSGRTAQRFGPFPSGEGTRSSFCTPSGLPGRALTKRSPTTNETVFETSSRTARERRCEPGSIASFVS